MNPKTYLNDLFDQLEPEEGNKLDDKIQVEDSVQKEFYNLINMFKKVKISEFNSSSVSESVDKLNLKKYSSKEITCFSVLIEEEILFPLAEYRFGLLFNEVIKRSADQNQFLVLKHYSKMWHVGDGNTKNIVINGDIKSCLGAGMKYGEIVVNGNSGMYTGMGLQGGKITINGNLKNYAGDSMHGGEIVANGNAGARVGESMYGGDIIVNGNVGESLGEHMSGGSIQIKGDIKSISSKIYGGDIYHKNKQIVKDGQILDRSYVEK